jgi:phage gp36-like protein
MTYATTTDIQSEFKSLPLSASSAVTTTEVEKFLEETDAIIDTFLAARYTLPITGTKSLLVLKKIEIDFVAYRVAKILNLKKEVPLPDENIIQELNEGAAYRESKKLLDGLFTGKMLLPDESPKTSGSGMSDYNSANSVEPIFERDTKQW